MCRFYVECARGTDGLCQQSGRRKTLRCAVQSHPPATVFRWLKNGVVTSGNGAEITIGTEMIGQSIQCQANNGLYSDSEMATSQAVQIDPYSSARLVQDNFATLQSAAPFQAGNRLEMNQQINLGCQVEGNPRPVVFWKLRKSNGQVADAPCAQGFDGQYQEVNESPRDRPIPPNVVSPSTNNAVVTVHYCAEPMPRPPREVIFTIDRNDLQIGQSWENFRFESTTQNNTVPNCYLARLNIAPVREEDQYRVIELRLQNQYGSKHLNLRENFYDADAPRLYTPQSVEVCEPAMGVYLSREAVV
ncbi:hypothetical protein NECAME_09682 [Necator americanus]|uniref:Ig-like domain-containing protein n=1 Tax=Necator americanus TaxID=51031 RepID=W2TCV4_NECAM|nr:hypothetical protein NECAME_09682 [Necator americanus]ETN79673.1 hypothetical protein NECAME_09682 [Necator americanus]